MVSFNQLQYNIDFNIIEVYTALPTKTTVVVIYYLFHLIEFDVSPKNILKNESQYLPQHMYHQWFFYVSCISFSMVFGGGGGGGGISLLTS